MVGGGEERAGGGEARVVVRVQVGRVRRRVQRRSRVRVPVGVRMQLVRRQWVRVPMLQVPMLGQHLVRVRVRVGFGFGFGFGLG